MGHTPSDPYGGAKMSSAGESDEGEEEDGDFGEHNERDAWSEESVIELQGWGNSVCGGGLYTPYTRR